jgi:alpha/beta superfamily hydrolase
MLQAERILIPGPAGNLETLIGPPLSSKRKLFGIICHPHPLYEGTMNNKVVATVVRVCQQLGIVPIRFNFRGVGLSEGQYDQGIGEQEDLKSVIKWCQTKYPDYSMLLAGFSFGSFIATKVATEICPTILITIAPPVHHNDFYTLPSIQFPWIIVQAEEDEVVPPRNVFDWIASLSPQPIVIRMPNATHFFHGHLITLRDQLIHTILDIW